MRGYAAQDTMMEGIGGATFSSLQAATQTTFGTTLQGQTIAQPQAGLSIQGQTSNVQPDNVQSPFGTYVSMQPDVNARNFMSSLYTTFGGGVPPNTHPKEPPVL